MSEAIPPEGLWIQRGLVPIEHHVVRLRLGLNKRTMTASVGVRIEDGDTEDLLGMWAGPIIPAEALEARAALVQAVVMERLEWRLADLEPF